MCYARYFGKGELRTGEAKKMEISEKFSGEKRDYNVTLTEGCSNDLYTYNNETLDRSR